MLCHVFGLRLRRGAEDRRNADNYIAIAARELELEAAAEAWSAGVEWNEALAIASRAIQKARKLMGPSARAKANPKAKPQGKAKAKGHAR